jgi:hypothetical protein
MLIEHVKWNAAKLGFRLIEGPAAQATPAAWTEFRAEFLQKEKCRNRKTGQGDRPPTLRQKGGSRKMVGKPLQSSPNQPKLPEFSRT